jgi:hypothetical protein
MMGVETVVSLRGTCASNEGVTLRPLYILCLSHYTTITRLAVQE